MYGMLLESVQHYVRLDYGDELWYRVLRYAGLKNVVITSHGLYHDNTMLDIAHGCSVVMGDRTAEKYLQYFGQCFVKYFSHYDYDKVVRVAGRHYRDFLIEIDNLHEMMRFSFPQLRSPSFNVQEETNQGCVLMYRSRRQGFAPYVIGQLKKVAEVFYNVHVDINIMRQYPVDRGCHTEFRLKFNNSAFVDDSGVPCPILSSLFPALSADTLFKVFPFCVVFDEELVIKHTGSNLPMLLETDNLRGSHMPTRFLIRRPLIEFTWNNMKTLQKVMFELQYRNAIRRTSSGGKPLTHKALLRGQVKYMDDWKMMVFLCTPLVAGLTEMEKMGLYISDLNMYDNSRQMVMTGWQNFSVLEYSIEQQVQQSEKISATMKELDQWQKQSNALLYSMIPESIANNLKNGVDPIKTCQVFDEVTILFTYMEDFSEICSRASPMQIVQCVNNVFMVFDGMVEKHQCFKVETLGDAVYMVAGGVPDRRPDHAILVAGLALDMLHDSHELQAPATGHSLQFRLGMHTGGVVAGVIGRRMPQYCLFGDTVNTASRMQSYGKPGKIHLSEPCHQLLAGKGFELVFRGTINVKGKGDMKTYWLQGREETPTVICEDVATDNSTLCELD